MPTDQVYWLFSTIAQTLAALVGVVGMVIIYKFQTIGNTERSIMNESSNIRMSVFGEKAINQNPSTFIKDYSKLKEKGFSSDNPYYESVKNFTERLAKLSINRTTLRITSYTFIISNSFMIFLSIAYIVFPNSFPIDTGYIMLSGTALAIIFVSTTFLYLTRAENY